MKGKILNFKAEQGFGFIHGEDNKKYFFHISNVSNPMDIEENYSVDFKVKEAKKGLNAINITVRAPLSGGRSKDKILKIKDLRIRASDIKEYEIIKNLKNGEYCDSDFNYYFIEVDPSDNERSLPRKSRELKHSKDYFKEFIFNELTRYCYRLRIRTYTTGVKYLEFRSHDGDKNKQEAYKWLDYLDDEMDKLV
jgi:cold shock CspA family protein